MKPLCVKWFGGISRCALTCSWAGAVGGGRARGWLGRRAGAWGWEPTAQAKESFPVALPGSLSARPHGSPAGVCPELGEDSVADPALQAPERLFGVFPSAIFFS